MLILALNAFIVCLLDGCFLCVLISYKSLLVEFNQMIAWPLEKVKT